jgi:hypothetical protein
MPPRTIDNLGVEVSTRWAEDQSKIDPLMKDASRVSQQAQIDVSFPSYSSEIEALLNSQKQNPTFASFSVPSKYAEQKKRLFVEHVVPSLGSTELIEAQIQRIKTRLPPKPAAQGDLKLSERWEEVREREDEEKEQKSLLDVLDCINFLDRDLIEVNSRRNQYQKG